MRKIYLTLACLLISLASFSQHWEEVEKMVLSVRGQYDYAGNSVSLYGNFAAVGVPNEDQDSLELGSLSSAGSVYIYKRKNSDTSWNVFQKLVANDRRAEDFFGASIKMYGDYLIVGAHSQDYDEQNNLFKDKAGAAYIFKYNSDSGKFIQQQKLVAPNRDKLAYFGTSVDINGNILAIGAFSADSGSVERCGAVYVYELDIASGIWQYTHMVTSPDMSTGDDFGAAVTLSGSTLLVGVPNENTDVDSMNALSRAGACYFYTRKIDKSWEYAQKVTASDRQAIGVFGASVALDGSFAVIGSYNNNSDSNNNNSMLSAGAAYFFQYKDGEWNEVKKVTAKYRSQYATFGRSVAMYGNLVVIGCEKDKYKADGTSTAIDAGSTYIYRRDLNSNWNIERILNSKIRTAEDQFGNAVAIYKRNVLIGAPGEDEDANDMFTHVNAGGAYMYELFCNNSVGTIDVIACGSSYTSPSGNFTWTTGGKYVDVITNKAGCDSLITINLSFGMPTSATISPVGCGSYTSPSGKYTWNTEGTYKDTIQNTSGCDSVLTINLSIVKIDKTVITQGAILTANQVEASYQWIDCADSSEVINEDKRVYIAAENKDYAVEISMDGCIDTSECVTVTRVGVNTLSNSFRVIAYPNPTNNAVTIELDGVKSNVDVLLTNAIGLEVAHYRLSGDKLKVILPQEEGVYFIKLTSGNKQAMLKVIKTK